MKKKDLYDEKGLYKYSQGQALVIHNNSDCVRTEHRIEHGMGSLDAAVGEASDRLCSLVRETIKPIIMTL